ncbi:TRAP transporter large permease subunit [Domibacillus enclensis]|uniref:TRAP C4-dicarboxylate transport system permease DctM subunit domain-containing protein n=1 Tax=Domibacillus enclensis TaxID=1017273 RepID=A0ABX4E6N4_9BACI|nr:TRAP transporter large permease subunit [Domibacillus enclensis]OXS76641.1 hypothetical protein B1B05_13305 [Domibacillus enclensis]
MQIRKCLSIGTLTPPLGTLMFTTCAITGTKVKDFVKESWPFLVVMVVAALIIAFIPGISMWLPANMS